MEIIKEKNDIAIVKTDLGYYHVVELYAWQVCSAMSSDSPSGGGRWFAGMTDAGVEYVSGRRTLSAARSGYRRLQMEIAEHE